MPDWRMLSSHVVQVERSTVSVDAGTGQSRAGYAVVAGMSSIQCGIQPLSQLKVIEALGLVFGESFTVAVDADLVVGLEFKGGDRLKDAATGLTYTVKQAQFYEGRMWVLFCDMKK